MTPGYLKLARRTFTHYLWEEKRTLSKFEAWIDLLQLAAFLPTRRIIRGQVIEIGRGEVIASLRYLGERWNWKKDKVASFLGLIEQDQMIRRSTRHQETVVTICNYEKYNGTQDTKPDSEPDTRPTVGRQPPDKVEEGKEGEEYLFAARQAGDGKGGGIENTHSQPEWLPKGWRSWSEKRKNQTRVGFNTEKMAAIGKALGRKASTLWTLAETEALLRIKPSEEEIEMIVDFYLATDIPEESDWRRRNLVTLLNNWNGELDKARLYRSERKRQSA